MANVRVQLRAVTGRIRMTFVHKLRATEGPVHDADQISYQRS